MSKGSEAPQIRSVVRLIECPKCHWVGALIQGYDEALREETGSWRCLSHRCQFIWDEANPVVLEKIPESQKAYGMAVLKGTDG